MNEDVEVLQGGAAATADHVVWLLHGRGATSEQIAAVLVALDAPGCVVLAPVGRWMNGAHWWIDSAWTGGRPVEAAVAGEVLPSAERMAGIGAQRRIIAGWSMGGAAALRWALAGRVSADSAVLLAPAAYPADPPLASSVRSCGAFGVGEDAFVPRRYFDTMCYQRLLRSRDVTSPLSVSLIVGADEEAQQFVDGWRSLREDASTLHEALVAAPGCTSSLDVVAGGHDEELWPAALTLGLRSLRPA